MICSRPDPYSDMAGIHCTIRSDTNHYYQRLVNSKLSFYVYRPRKLKTFEAITWSPPIAQKTRTDAQFIANALLFSIVGNISFVQRTAIVLALKHPSGPKFVHFTSHRFVGLLLLELLLSRSSRGSSAVIFGKL